MPHGPEGDEGQGHSTGFVEGEGVTEEAVFVVLVAAARDRVEGDSQVLERLLEDTENDRVHIAPRVFGVLVELHRSCCLYQIYHIEQLLSSGI